MCCGRISSWPSRSAIVRATRNTLSCARAESPRSSIAALRIACASGLSTQCFRTCRGVIRPLTCGPRAPNRFDCRARASWGGLGGLGSDLFFKFLSGGPVGEMAIPLPQSPSLSGREQPLLNQRSTDPDDVGIVHRQNGDRRPPDGGPADQEGAVPAEVPLPLVASRVEELG